MRVALYLRVSTNEQNTDNHFSALEAFAKSTDWEIVRIYSEDSTAWKDGHQKELKGLRDDITNGKYRYDIVLVWALDRLSRQGSAAILNTIDGFKTYGVRVISLKEPWTEAPGIAGEILYSIVGWVAKQESERISDRTKAGLAHVRLYGSKSGIGIGQRGKDKQKRRRSGYLLRYVDK